MSKYTSNYLHSRKLVLPLSTGDFLILIAYTVRLEPKVEGVKRVDRTEFFYKEVKKGDPLITAKRLEVLYGANGFIHHNECFWGRLKDLEVKK